MGMIESPYILSERRGCLGVLTLNRPQALNALTLDMVLALRSALDHWADDDSVTAVLLKGAGRAFCAGGDIRAIWEAARQGEEGPAAEFYGTEYHLDLAINRYPKPVVSLLNGIVMGGGAGLSMLGSHRVVTGNALYAMPETAIGFFPDVGGSWVLPRLPGALGLYLGLTGTRLGPADLLYAGLATHAVAADSLPALEDALAGGADLDATLAAFRAVVGEPLLPRHRPAIDRIFGSGEPERIVAELRQEPGDWAVDVLRLLSAVSPTSLVITAEQLRRGARLDLAGALTMEFRLALRVAMGHEFQEGVRAMLVDRDKAPRWVPATLSEVDRSAVAALFEPLGSGRDLVLP